MQCHDHMHHIVVPCSLKYQGVSAIEGRSRARRFRAAGRRPARQSFLSCQSPHSHAWQPRFLLIDRFTLEGRRYGRNSGTAEVGRESPLAPPSPLLSGPKAETGQKRTVTSVRNARARSPLCHFLSLSRRLPDSHASDRCGVVARSGMVATPPFEVQSSFFGLKRGLANRGVACRPCDRYSVFWVSFHVVLGHNYAARHRVVVEIPNHSFVADPAC